MASGDLPQADFTEILAHGMVSPEEEGLFARDVDGRLIRAERATLADLQKKVRLTIDGQEVTVNKAVPEQDSQGRIIFDENDQPKPRDTTIFDAAAEAFVRRPGDPHPIPTLCHKEHLPPVGVCRVCLVELVEKTSRGTKKKFVPACKQAVSEGMEVHTLESRVDPAAAARVKAATGVVVELLATDHLPQHGDRFPAATESQLGNELAALTDRLGIASTRFGPKTFERGKDLSSHMVAVDHEQCIMCGRCVRGCNWVKHNEVIGRSGKGYESTIAFDLNQPMAESNCVSCAECVISCPTGAMEFQTEFLTRQQEVVIDRMDPPVGDGEIVPPEELASHAMFKGIPHKFLQLNALAVVRRNFQAGDVVCREGEYGSTAFLIEKGSFKIFLNGSRGAARTSRAPGLAGWLGGLRTRLTKTGGEAQLADVAGASLPEGGQLIRSVEDVILGEMTCMNRYPRSATVIANEESEVLEIRRNVLYMLQRNEVSRDIIERAYRSRALVGQLEKIPFLKSLDTAAREAAAEFLKERVDLISVEPNQVIFQQGDAAEDFYIVKLGFVKVTQAYGANDRVLNYLSPGTHFGEIGLLSELGDLTPQLSAEQHKLGTRTATCSALDHVELIRLQREDFIQLLDQFPELKQPMLDTAHELLERDHAMRRLESIGDQDFLDQGLYLAQSLLVLDLERCTRCDECTKACADTHDGVTRLVRDGLRFDRFLVASSCRSCLDPYCLVGCPVDAIHRNGDSLEINIEDYCIGCGLCASNCPYGNINMHQLQLTKSERQQSAGEAMHKWQATTCDLCSAIDGKPSCVYACPHNAAFRMTGQELLETIRHQ